MNEFRIQQKLMGTAFELVIGHDQEKAAKELLELGVEEIIRIEKLLTEFSEESVTSLINKKAGFKSVQVPYEVFQLIQRSINLSELTQGAFDISIAPLKKLYNFKRGDLKLLSEESLNSVCKTIGYKNIHLGKNNSVYLTKKGMQISFASIGKGYAADCVKKMWLEKGVKSGVISASGDLSVIGNKPDGSKWKIGIPDPETRSKILLYIPVNEGAVATSGDYEQFFMLDGERYSHTIDPNTGLPTKGIKNVTITGPSAELCDTLATAVTVMGVEVGLHFINQLPNTHSLIIDSMNKLHYSKNIIFEKTI